MAVVTDSIASSSVMVLPDFNVPHARLSLNYAFPLTLQVSQMGGLGEAPSGLPLKRTKLNPYEHVAGDVGGGQTAPPPCLVPSG
jgi:hypothetical protein